MNFEGLKNYEFFISLGYVTIIASILTMIVTQIIKVILKKRKKIYVGMDPTEKDVILSRVGRIVALVIYASLYIGNEFYLKHTITFDGALLTGLLSGSTFTLTIAKGLYTMIRQYQKKQTVFEKLKYAEETIKKLEEPLKQGETLQETLENTITTIAKETPNLEIKSKWILTNKK